MNFSIFDINGILITELLADGQKINELQDVLDLMGDSFASGSPSIIIYEEQLMPGFFDLKTGIAGEVLQKFSNYNMKIAIVGDFSKYASKSLKDFIYECNNGKRIFFTSSKSEAIIKLSGE